MSTVLRLRKSIIKPKADCSIPLPKSLHWSLIFFRLRPKGFLRLRDPSLLPTNSLPHAPLSSSLSLSSSWMEHGGSAQMSPEHKDLPDNLLEKSTLLLAPGKFLSLLPAFDFVQSPSHCMTHYISIVCFLFPPSGMLALWAQMECRCLEQYLPLAGAQ